jgi:predicted membrane protein
MTQDMRSIDGVMMWYLEGLASQGIQMIIDLFSAVLFVPVFTIPGVAIALVGMYVGSKYLKAQLSVKRETRLVVNALCVTDTNRRDYSNAKAPMVAHFGAAMAGLGALSCF